MADQSTTFSLVLLFRWGSTYFLNVKIRHGTLNFENWFGRICTLRFILFFELLCFFFNLVYYFDVIQTIADQIDERAE